MNGIQAFSSGLWVGRLGWTLLHFLWQGTAIAVFYMIVRFLFARILSPRARYAFACATLLAMAVAPPLTYLTISSGVTAPAQTASWGLAPAEWTWLPAAFVSFWVAGVFGFSIRLFAAFRYSRRLRTTSHPAPPEWQQTLQQVAVRMGQPFFVGGRSARLAVSSLVNVPAIIGFLQPLILVPAAALTGLPPEHIRALLAHEMAHIRRNDYIAGILQSMAEVVLFYHPAVWWISGQIRAERELCCDDLVIAAGTDILTYARALTELESQRPARLRLQLAATSGSLADRIRRLIDPAHMGPNCLPRAGSAWAMVLLWLMGAGVSAVTGAQKAIPAPRAVSFASAAQSPAVQPVMVPALPAPVTAALPGPAPALPDPIIAPPGAVSTLASHARDTLLFDPVLTAQLAQPQPRAPSPGAPGDAPTVVDPTDYLTMAVEVNYFRLNNAEYFAPVSLVIPGGVLAQARKSGADRTQIDLLGEITDDLGTTVQKTHDQINVSLSGNTPEELSNKPVSYGTGYTLLPGTYSLKITARDSATGRSGTFTSRFTIPNLNKEDQRLPISSVVLGSQRPLAAPAYEAPAARYKAVNRTPAGAVAGAATRQAMNPLFQGGQELVPNITHVFSSGNEMVVYLQALEKGATATQPLTASVTLLQNSAQVMEMRLTVAEGLDPKSKMLPIKLNIPLSNLKPGAYTCQVTVLDPATQKTASWQAPVMVTP